jgi:uncharacterized damage-inducible protein DinB
MILWQVADPKSPNQHVGVDEYELAVGKLVSMVEELSDDAYELVRDTATADEDCRSIQTIVTHVVRAGYGYAGMLRREWGIEHVAPRPGRIARREARSQLEEMLAYACATLDGRWGTSEADAAALRLRSAWGPVYDLEQLLEHAIAHVLRHRRQIGRFLER